MRPFTLLSTASRASAAGWQARFSKRLLITLLMAGAFLTSLALLAPASAKAQAIPVTTHPIQLSNLTMIDQQHGWAFDGNHKHIFATNQGPEHWSDVTPTLLIQNPNDIITTSFFLNATHGYVGIFQGEKTLLLSTQDSGRTWQSTTFNIPIIDGPVGIEQITFLDVQHGWLSFSRNQRQPGQFDILMMSTTNGGKTWQTLFDTSQNPASLPIPYSQSSNFTFSSPENGWVTGIWLSGDVYLYATHNGGKTWSKSSIAPIKGAVSIDFTQGTGPFWQNSETGTLFVKYDTSTGNGMPHLTAYQTRNAGKSWILEPSSPSTSFQEFSNLSFLNNQEGWSFGFDGQGKYILHHTSNGGQTWNIFNPTGLIQAQADTQVLADLTFLNTTTGWVIIKDEQNNFNLFQTNTGGKTWHALHPVIG